MLRAVDSGEPPAVPALAEVGAEAPSRADVGVGEMPLRADAGAGEIGLRADTGDMHIRAESGPGEPHLRAEVGAGDTFLRAETGAGGGRPETDRALALRLLRSGEARLLGIGLGDGTGGTRDSSFSLVCLRMGTGGAFAAALASGPSAGTEATLLRFRSLRGRSRGELPPVLAGACEPWR